MALTATDGALGRFGNPAYIIIVEKVAGMPYGVFLNEKVLIPLEMRGTGVGGGPREPDSSLASRYVALAPQAVEKAPNRGTALEAEQGVCSSKARLTR
jgi:CubicO group peptidase (beta-lactamase class C family)